MVHDRECILTHNVRLGGGLHDALLFIHDLVSAYLIGFHTFDDKNLFDGGRYIWWFSGRTTKTIIGRVCTRIAMKCIATFDHQF